MEERTEVLLKMLPNLGSKAFKVFLDSLKTDYNWRADLLEEAFDDIDPKKNNEDDVDSAEVVRQK